MTIYLIYSADDPEWAIGVFENQKDVQFVLDSIPEDFDALEVKEYAVDDEDKDKTIYIPTYDGDTIDDNCFTKKEDIIEYLDENGYDEETLIHGLELNKLYDDSVSIDENGIYLPNDDEEDFTMLSVYKAYQQDPSAHGFVFANGKFWGSTDEIDE